MMIEEVYDALIEAGASEEKARAAARTLAAYHTDLQDIKGELRLHRWILTFIGGLQIPIFFLLLNLALR